MRIASPYLRAMADTPQRTEIGRLGEFGLIDRLTAGFEAQQPTTALAAGDDCAVLTPGDQTLLVTTDMLVEGVHFDLTFHPLRHLGYKAVVVNLSDIYAMNGTPRQITVSMAVSNRFSVEALDELYAGIRLACEHDHVDLVGGDTTASPRGLVLSITALGSAPASGPVMRSGARPGDVVCVSGDLGGAYIGLQVLNREKSVYLENPDMQPQLDDHAYVVGRQLKPEARRDIVRVLADAGVVPTAMIDVSDGLSSDLLHICDRSDVGVRIHESEVPIHRDVYEMAIEFGLDPITVALSGGEDYELLFTVAEDDLPALMDKKPDVAAIGRITNASDGRHLISRSGIQHDLTAQGWKHLSDDA